MDVEFIKSELVKENYLKEIIYFDEIESTNSHAKKNNFGNDLLIITSNQTAGTGRFNRSWKASPAKDLTFTLIKSFRIGIDNLHLVNFYSSYILFITLQEILKKYEFKDFFLKWPNDILLNGKKIAGLLLDVRDLRSEFKKFIIGIGLNVNSNEFPEDLSLRATSILNETNSLCVIEKILILFVKNFYENLSLLENKDDLMKRWIMNTNVIGKDIAFRRVEDEQEKRATVIDINPDGGLKVRFEDNTVKKFYSGEISILIDPA